MMLCLHLVNALPYCARSSDHNAHPGDPELQTLSESDFIILFYIFHIFPLPPPCPYLGKHHFIVKYKQKQPNPQFTTNFFPSRMWLNFC